MSEALRAALIDKAVNVIAVNAEALTKLDQAIGDGDHGINLKRGFEAVASERDQLISLNVADALQKAGMILVMKVGGASGPLYGSLLMGMAKAAKAGHDIEGQLREGIAAVRKRGKSDRGAKTMLDVLIPVQETLQEHHDLSRPEMIMAIRQTADEAREATKAMLATRGRASFLGERSIGHYDPGATSCQLLIKAICDVVEEQV